MVLPGFHAFTGCDSSSAFVRKGKKKPLAVMMSSPHICEVFAQCGDVVTDISDTILQSLENFVCAIYGFPKVSDVNRLRSLIFQSRFGAKLPRIMSTEAASGIDLSSDAAFKLAVPQTRQ